MSPPRLFVVVTGLPASGKTTLGRALSDSLHLPFMDKDDVLETLFDALGANSPEDRSRLSRASDAVLESMALASQGAVLASFWRRPHLSITSGTPSDWLSTLNSDAVVEVLCECDPTVAANRFARRRRHPGHFDHRIAEDELRAGFEQLANEGPLFGRSPVRVDTSGPVDPCDVTVSSVKQPRLRVGAPPADHASAPRCRSSASVGQLEGALTVGCRPLRRRSDRGRPSPLAVRG